VSKKHDRKKQKAKRKESKPRTRAAKERVEKVLHQVKEPLSLLSTLREEGLNSAMTFLTMASGASKNLRFEAIRPQLKEIIGSLGFATRADLDRLEMRIEELEHKLSDREYAALTGVHGEAEDE
jgi:hypothetical protein